MEINGQIRNTAKSGEINCHFGPTNLSDGVSNKCMAQNLGVLNFTYVSTSTWLISSEHSGETFACCMLWNKASDQVYN